jgi:hypothetical protein
MSKKEVKTETTNTETDVSTSIHEYIIEVAEILQILSNVANLLKEYKNLLDAKVDISKLVNFDNFDTGWMDKNINMLVYRKPLRKLQIIPELKCVDTNDYFNIVRIRCETTYCVFRFYRDFDTDNKLLEVELAKQVPIKYILELACNLTIDDLKKYKEDLIRISNGMAKSIELLKQILTSVKVIMT